MTAHDKATRSHSASNRSRRLRIVGVAALLLGLGGAGLVYWLGTRSPDVMDDLALVGFNQAQSRQMSQLYGKMGLVVEQFFDDLKQPGTQAKIIIAASILVAGGCFYFASLMDRRDEQADGPGAHPGG